MKLGTVIHLTTNKKLLDEGSQKGDLNNKNYC